MEVKIKAIHFDATAKLEEFINKKAQRLARRNEEVTEFNVTLEAVDLCIDALERQLEKFDKNK